MRWIFALLLLSVSTVQAQSLTVAIKDAPPFVIIENGEYTGVSVELWELLAENLGLEYSFTENDLPGLLDAVENEEVDLGIAAITVTRERETLFDFSYPYYATGLSVAVNPGSSNLLSRIRSLLSPQLFLAVAALCGLLLTVGGLIWALEHRANPEEFGGGFVRGLGEGFWWSAVTMTTVGYGDRSPKTFGGRLLALVWMFSSLIILGGFIAAFTAAITVSGFNSRIETLDDVRGLDVGTLSSSATEDFLSRERIAYRSYDDINEALSELAADNLDAVIHDDAILRYLTQQQDAELRILPELYDEQEYAIALPSNSPIRERLNRELIALLKSDEWSGILARYGL